jgi:hypothetical protein
MSSRWWRDTCVLFAKMDGHFEWLIEKIPLRQLQRTLRGTLGAMINARPPWERGGLLAAVRRRFARESSALNLSDSELLQVLCEEDEDEWREF